MKTRSVYLYTIFLLGILFVSSCTKDTTEPNTVNERDKFLGTWSVNEIHTKLTYEVTILADESSSTEVNIYNFGASGNTVKTKAVVEGEDIGIFPSNQSLSNGWIVDGSGYMSGSTKISWTYTINDGANLIYAQATYTKK